MATTTGSCPNSSLTEKTSVSRGPAASRDSLLAREILLTLFRQVQLIRTAEEEIARRYTEGKMRCPVHLCTGQEAVAGVVGALLEKTDFAVSTHRSHGHYLGKGGDLKRMLAEIYGKATGCAMGKGGSMHLVDTSVGFMGSTAIVGGTIPVGVGLGLSAKLKGSGQISCVYFGEGATEEGAFFEAVNFAVLRKLPVLFVCENNLYSVYSPLSVRQPDGRRVFEMVRGLGLPSSHGDGNDVLDVYRKTEDALTAIRAGSGPYLLEFPTYRWREHCGPHYDNHIGYRSVEEYEEWKKRDPIALFERHLLMEAGILEERLNEIREAVSREVEDAFNFAEESPFPAESEIYTQVFAKNEGE